MIPRSLTAPSGAVHASRRTRAALALAIPASLLSSPAHASDKGWADASDVARTGLVIAALGVPAIQSDWEGDKQAALSVGSAFVVSEGLKAVIDAERPDGSGNDSFPSGHTATSFAAAAMLQKRYGWKIGLPAHAVAAFVGLARVEADKHYVRDVLAGAAIGEAAGLVFSRPKDARVQWMPWGDAHGGGVTVAMHF